jgi:hypothetical protein
MKEIHLFIIWSEGIHKKKDILDDIKSNFAICKIYNTKWSKEHFSNNLSRLYGEKLPKNSHKEKHCGIDTFCCIVVKDENPTYEIRETTKGYKVVNSKLFDAKQLYRSWTGGGHKIHATDNIIESKLQLALLFGENCKNYLGSAQQTEEINYHHDLVGANGWESFNELFEILNLTSKYVVLRNYDNLESQFTSLHPDVDLLVENKEQTIDILNAKATTNKKYRVQYSVKINNKNINFDLRHVGDGYYDYRWENDILKRKIKLENIFVPDDLNLFYSLLYHVFIHKKNVSSDYLVDFIALSKPINLKLKTSDLLEENLMDMLLTFMHEEKYSFIEPNDLTVYYNTNILKRRIALKVSRKRNTLNKYFKFRSHIKQLLLRILTRLRISFRIGAGGL